MFLFSFSSVPPFPRSGVWLLADINDGLSPSSMQQQKLRWVTRVNELKGYKVAKKTRNGSFRIACSEKWQLSGNFATLLLLISTMHHRVCVLKPDKSLGVVDLP